MKSPYTYKYIAPNNPLINEDKPAIFLFHGLGSDENDLLQLVNSLQDTFHIFSLRGPITNPPGYAFYTFEEEGKPIQEVFDKMIIFTQQFILEAIEKYPIDPNNVYVVGFNQGAVVSQTLLVTMGEKIKGAAALSGFLPEFVKNEYRKMDLQNSKIFISHGEYDFDYPIGWSEISKSFFQELEAKVTYKTYPVGHGVSEDNVKDLIAFLLEDVQILQ